MRMVGQSSIGQKRPTANATERFARAFAVWSYGLRYRRPDSPSAEPFQGSSIRFFIRIRGKTKLSGVLFDRSPLCINPQRLRKPAVPKTHSEAGWPLTHHPFIAEDRALLRFRSRSASAGARRGHPAPAPHEPGSTPPEDRPSRFPGAGSRAGSTLSRRYPSTFGA